jgi:predicted DNA binding CopG/RHH family protein
MRRPDEKALSIKVVADHVEESAEVSGLVDRLEEEADREIAAGTITMRWGRERIAVVMRAAALIGVPYHTYLKQVGFKQALADIAQAEGVLDSGRSGS